MPVLRARREKVSPVVKECYIADITVDISLYFLTLSMVINVRND